MSYIITSNNSIINSEFRGEAYNIDIKPDVISIVNTSGSSYQVKWDSPAKVFGNLNTLIEWLATQQCVHLTS